jgi:integrase/recombinase XerD
VLKDRVDAFLALRRAMGFELETEGYLLHDFARWAAARGEPHVRTQTAMQWAAAARSPWQRERRLRTVAIFARHARVEDPHHEVPPTSVFGFRHRRPTPYIYSPQEVRRLLDAASRLAPTWPLRAQVFTTLFGLLASTGLRVSEALALRFDDVTADGLIIRQTKFKKTRLVPLHPSTAAALDRFLDLRRRVDASSDYLFVSPNGGRLAYTTIRTWFTRLVRDAGLPSRQMKGPRIHDLRHTFAVRALEASPDGASHVGRHVRALSTYLGHVHLADTYWYLHATPQLMRGVADACERFLEGDAP